MLFGGNRWPNDVRIALACLEGEPARSPDANCHWDRYVSWAEEIVRLPKLGGPSGTEPLS